MKKLAISAVTALALTMAGGVFAATQGTQAPMMLASASTTMNKAEVVGSDSWITTKVKAKLLKAKGVPSAQITVETNNGVVSLSGTVTAAQKRAAVALAKGTKHVKSVSADGLTTS